MRIALAPFFQQVSCKTDFILAALVMLAVGLSSTCVAQQWQGCIECDDGVVRVHNPATPCHAPEKIQADEIWRIDGQNDEIVFGDIANIVLGPGGLTCILDSQLKEVVVLDQEGRLLRRIGREGDGPGEFIRPTGLFITPENQVAVSQIWPPKIVLLSPEGVPQGNHPLPFPNESLRMFVARVNRAGDHLVGRIYRRDMNEDGVLVGFDALIAFDGEGGETARYTECELVRTAADGILDERDILRGFPLDWDVAADGRVFTLPKYTAWQIDVYLPGGELDRVITRDFQPRRRPESEFTALTDYYDEHYEGRRWRTRTPIEYKVSPTDADIQELFVREDGSLWVLSSHGALDVTEGEIGTFDILDAEGRFMRQITLLGEGDYYQDSFMIRGDLLFVITNEGADIPGWQNESKTTGDEGADVFRSVICYRLP